MLPAQGSVNHSFDIGSSGMPSIGEKDGAGRDLITLVPSLPVWFPAPHTAAATLH